MSEVQHHFLSRYDKLCYEFAQTKSIDEIQALFETYLQEVGQDPEALRDLWYLLDLNARWMPDFGQEELGRYCVDLIYKLDKYVDRQFVNRVKRDQFYDLIAVYQ